MGTFVMDVLLIVVMLIAFDWRESRWARSASRARTGLSSKGRPAPVLCDAAPREAAAATLRTASWRKAS